MHMNAMDFCILTLDPAKLLSLLISCNSLIGISMYICCVCSVAALKILYFKFCHFIYIPWCLTL